MIRPVALYVLLFDIAVFAGADSIVNGYLAEVLKEYSRFDYTIVSGLQEKAEYRIDLSRQFERFGATGYIPVVVTIGGSSYKTNIQVKLKLFRYVYVTKVDGSFGMLLKSENIEVTERDVAAVKEPVYADVQIQSYRLRASVKKGEVLSLGRIELAPVVFPGDKVTAYKKLGSVEISFDASVQNEGRVGETVRITGPEKKLYRAKVENNFSVQIIE